MAFNASDREKCIFLEAIDIERKDDRVAYLNDACGTNHALRQRVEELLAAHESPESLLDHPPTQETDATVASPAFMEEPDDVIGPYHLREQIGEGGMGIVFVADQKEPLRRRVAIKVIKPGLDTKSVIARFEAERQALAVMDHPNIAKVLDAGTTEKGRPYFVMELVNGIPITAYCDRQRLTISERLELFESVCRAIQHAHRKGIIHRDIKPSNVLVTEQDGRAIPKVIDFGVAKAIGQRLTDKTVYTSFQAVVGTPLYMSPEQAALSNVDVDTRSDVYSLGVLLYELLTGTTPFDKEILKKAAQDEVLRIIREQEPPKPSTKISTLGDKATAVSQDRRVDVASLGRAVRGDLDWIVMKALDKDRSRRYESASDLAKEIMRFLSHEPVEARAPSTVYRLQKFLRRNKSMIRAAGVAMVLLAACGGLLNQILKMKEQQRTADLVVKAHEDIIKAEQLIEQGKTEEAFGLLNTAEAILPNDEKLVALRESISVQWRVLSMPQDATLVVRPAGPTKHDWRLVGHTNVEFSNPRGLYHWRISKEGFQDSEGLAGPEAVEIHRTMVPTDKSKEGMVLVPIDEDSSSPRQVWIDRHEVTNAEYKEFIDSGGYCDEGQWKHLSPYRWNGEELEFEEFSKKLLDATGNAGPSAWRFGSFHAGEESLPVAGICWYEAAAYAKFRGKELPTKADWERAACLEQFEQLAKYQVFGARRPQPVCESGAINSFGIYDMGGNVKEWCMNSTNDGRRIARGGAWNEHNYMFRQMEAYPPHYRSHNIGLRCVMYDVPPPLVETQSIEFGGNMKVVVKEGFSQEDLLAVRRRFDYDRKAALAAKVIEVDSTESWRHEVIEIDAAYGGERLSLHLFYPKESAARNSPYQPLLYYPGNGVTGMESIEKSGRWADLAIVVGLVQTGRAVCWPVYKGTLERTDGYFPKMSQHRKFEFFVKQAQDLFRAVDFLQQRPELDISQLTYVGWSRGGGVGPAFVVLEPRIQACVLMSGGLSNSTILEMDISRYAPLVKVPTLVMNGVYDNGFEERQIPLYNAIGSSDKQFKEYESGHVMELEKAIDDIDEWLTHRFLSETAGKKNNAERLQFAKSLASGYFGERRYNLAEEKYREVLRILEDSEVASIRDVFEAKLRLALSIQHQGQEEDAQELLQQLLTEQQASPEASEDDLERTKQAIEELRLKLEK